MSLVIYQDEASKWGPNPLRAMHEAHKERQRKWAQEAAKRSRDLEQAKVAVEIAKQQFAQQAEKTKAAEHAEKVARVAALKLKLENDQFQRMRWLVAEAARAFGVTADAIYGHRRSPAALIEARHVAMYLVCENTEWSFPRIARFFARDHSTLLYVRNKIRDLLPQDADLAHTVAMLELVEPVVEDTGIVDEV